MNSVPSSGGGVFSDMLAPCRVSEGHPRGCPRPRSAPGALLGSPASGELDVPGPRHLSRVRTVSRRAKTLGAEDWMRLRRTRGAALALAAVLLLGSCAD